MAEVPTAKRGKLAIVQGGDIRGAWQTADEGHFSEEIAGSQFDSSISDGDLNLAVDNEVDSIGFFAGPKLFAHPAGQCAARSEAKGLHAAPG